MMVIFTRLRHTAIIRPTLYYMHVAMVPTLLRADTVGRGG